MVTYHYDPACHYAQGHALARSYRKAEGRFPESKELKQLIRDMIAPERDLGHSDKQGHSDK